VRENETIIVGRGSHVIRPTRSACSLISEVSEIVAVEESVMHATALALGVVLLATVTFPDGAHGEGFVDFRIGGAVTQDTDGSSTVGPVGDPPQVFTGSGPLEFKAGVSLGIRGGYWLESVPYLGFALDLSFFNTEEDVSQFPLKLQVYPISGLLMLRYPLLTGSAYPRGRLQPYVGVGPGAFIATAKLDVPDPVPENFTSSKTTVGLDVRGGVGFHFTGPRLPGESIAIFVEYRFTYFQPPTFQDDVAGVLPIELDISQLDSHHITAGVGWYF
jgi:hypothetical protein